MKQQINGVEESEVIHDDRMGKEPVSRLLFSMSFPVMLSMLVQALYNIVDSMFVARLNENALTAVSLAFPVQSLMMAVAVGTGIGIGSLLSKSLGEQAYENANKAAENGYFLAVAAGVVFAVFGLLGAGMFSGCRRRMYRLLDMVSSM